MPSAKFGLVPFGDRYTFAFILESVHDILGKAGLSVAGAPERANQCGPKGVFYLDIEFWYSEIGSQEVIRNPKQPHYFDSESVRMIADF